MDKGPDSGEAYHHRPYDAVLYGATGFVGRLTAEHLAQVATGVRIALAGRDRQKLEAVQRELGVDWPVIVTDLTDDNSVEELASSTRVIGSAIGRHSLPLARASARTGTAYADLSGEVPFVRRSIDELHHGAQATGARIGHGCGVDAVPADLSIFLLTERARADGQGTLTGTSVIVESFKGGFSRGNLDSNQAQSATLRSDPALQAAVASPWALAETPPVASFRDADPTGAFRDDLTRRWLAPSFGGAFNSRFVRRSASLADGAYGPDFHYREGIGVGTAPLAHLRATTLAGSLSLVRVALTSRTLQPIMQRLLPPGSGPSKRVRDNGRFRISAHTRTSTGARYVADLAFRGDPGYAATSVMLGQAMLSLGTDPLDSAGGVVTPSLAMGHHLADRLTEQGFRISVQRV